MPHRFLLCFCLLLLLETSLAQVNWEELTTVDTEVSYTLLSVSDGLVFKTNHEIPLLVRLDDVGENWEILYEGDPLSRYGRDMLRYGNDGTIYISMDEGIFKYDYQEKTMELVISTNAVSDLKDFIVLVDNSVLIATEDKAALYDSQGVLVKEGWEFDSQLIGLIESSSGYFYAQYKREILKIDINLDIVEEIDSPNTNGFLYKIYDGKIYTGGQYSLDGISWQPYLYDGLLISGHISIDDHGNIFVYNGLDVFMSADEGISFNKFNSVLPIDIPLNFDSPGDIYWSSRLDGMVMTLKSSYCEDVTYFSQNGIDGWNKVSAPFVLNERARLLFATDENLYFRYCSNIYSMDFSHLSVPWEKVNIDHDYRVLLATRDGTLVTDGLYRSIDKGVTWNKTMSEVTPDNLIFPDFSIKNDTLLLTQSPPLGCDSISVFHSVDLGLTWQKVYTVEQLCNIQPDQSSDSFYSNGEMLLHIEFEINPGAGTIPETLGVFPGILSNNVSSDGPAFRLLKTNYIGTIGYYSHYGVLTQYTRDEGPSIPPYSADISPIGNVYFDFSNNLYATKDSKTLLKIDTTDNSVSNISPTNLGTRKMKDLVFSPNGIAYLLLDNGDILKVNSDISNTQEVTAIKGSSTIHPIPASSTIFISSEKRISTYNLLSLNGELILTKNGNSSLDVNAVDNGMYFLTITFDDGKQEIHKVIVTH